MPDKYNDLFAAAEKKYGLPPNYLRNFYLLERAKRGNAATALGPETKSGRAVGIMQIMPLNYNRFGGDPTDPAQSIDMAGRLSQENLRMLRKLYPDISEEELYRRGAYAYQSGYGTVRDTNGVPTYPGAIKYMKQWDALQPPKPTPDPYAGKLEGLNPYYGEELAPGALFGPASPDTVPPAPKPTGGADVRSLKFLMDLFNSTPKAPESYPSDTYLSALRRG